jgi:ribosome-binding protein aMBF1 (putative translation factor)
MKKEKDITTFDAYLDETYGKVGTKTRTDFDIKAKAFAIGEIIKEERRLSKMTQEELAHRTGTKKSIMYPISRAGFSQS